MMDVINWDQEIFIDECRKNNLHEYSPHTRTDLIAQFTDIRIEIQNQNQFLLIPIFAYILWLNFHMLSHINM